MKSTFTLFLLIFALQMASAQCDDLFFSEYVEGYANNKGLEIYNPTGQAVNLSDYAIARASNGSTAPASNQIISLPDVMLESNDVFVVVVDLRDTALWDSQFDKPVWNGYNLIDTLFDAVTGEAITDSLGNVIFGPQYTDTGSALFGTEYNERYDMQCKADAFLCPDYDQNNTMYFNGNDAVILLKGDQISPTGDNIIDVIGVIGEDPEETIMEDAWVNDDGFWVTKNRTLVRKEGVTSGRNNLQDVVFALGGTFKGEEWYSYRNNSFEYLGIHNSVCNNVDMPSQYSCSEGPITAIYSPTGLKFNLYPNPFESGQLTIETEHAFIVFELYDMLGRRVYTQSLNDVSRIHNITLAGLETGMYSVRLLSGDKSWAVSPLLVK